MNTEPKQAKVKITKTIKILGHPCKACEWNNPPIVFEGLVNDSGIIEWPVFAKYRISYCPHCGMKLPIRYPLKVGA